jgi:riboflavin synthase
MFTGLIERVGRVRRLDLTGASARLEVDTELASELAVGDSLATNGVCLTVAISGNGNVGMDVSPETLRVTALRRLRQGDPVNLERPVRADGRFGGHLVQGHVDGTARIVRADREGDFWRLRIGLPVDLSPYVVAKGSIAVDGISLTVASLTSDSFDVQIVPHTWAHTTLSSTPAGAEVNLECDLIGKYVVRALQLR